MSNFGLCLGTHCSGTRRPGILFSCLNVRKLDEGILKSGRRQHRLKMSTLKGLSYEIDFENVDEN